MFVSQPGPLRARAFVPSRLGLTMLATSWLLAGFLLEASGDEPPAPPAELHAEFVANASAEAPIVEEVRPAPPADQLDPAAAIADAVQPAVVRVAPPPPPEELFTEACVVETVGGQQVILSPATDGGLPANARVFSIFRVEQGTQSDGSDSSIRFAGIRELPTRVFELSALPGTDESIDASILELPRVYRIAEVQLDEESRDNGPGENVNGESAQSSPSDAPRRPAAKPVPDLPGRSDDPMVAMGFKPLSQVTVDTEPPANPDVDADLQRPRDEAAAQFRALGGYTDVARIGDVGLDAQMFLEPADFCYAPLYFEEVNLERFGTSCAPRLQPAISGARFFLTVPALPYLMTAQRPRQCYYDLTPYRPGRPAPWHRELPPLRLDAAAVEAAVLAGLVFAIP